MDIRLCKCHLALHSRPDAFWLRKFHGRHMDKRRLNGLLLRTQLLQTRQDWSVILKAKPRVVFRGHVASSLVGSMYSRIVDPLSSCVAYGLLLGYAFERSEMSIPVQYLKKVLSRKWVLWFFLSKWPCGLLAEITWFLICVSYPLGDWNRRRAWYSNKCGILSAWR